MRSDSMDARAYWTNYVQRHGGPRGVSDRLDLPYSTVACICNGSRGIGHALATRMAEADPELDRSVLVWVRPTEKPAGEGAALT